MSVAAPTEPDDFSMRDMKPGWFREAPPQCKAAEAAVVTPDFHPPATLDFREPVAHQWRPHRNPDSRLAATGPSPQLSGARAHGTRTYEPRQGRKAATVVCSRLPWSPWYSLPPSPCRGLSIVADGLRRTLLQSLHRQGHLLRRDRLLEDVAISTHLAAPEESALFPFVPWPPTETSGQFAGLP